MNYGGGRKSPGRPSALPKRCSRAAEPRGAHRGALLQYLYTGGQPDPDLIIRPSGEERLSISCCGRAPMPSWSTLTFFGPTLKPATWTRLWLFTPRANGALGGYNPPVYGSRDFSTFSLLPAIFGRNRFLEKKNLKRDVVMKQRVLSGAILVVFFAAVIVFNRSFPLALNIVVALISATAVLELIRALGLLRKWSCAPRLCSPPPWCPFARTTGSSQSTACSPCGFFPP